MPTASPTIPAGLPVLGAGRHLGPDDGGCIMEIASLLAGERWSDHPRSVDPLLALLARAVNDAVTDGFRPRLLRLVPDMIGTRRRVLDRAPRLVSGALAAARSVGIDDARFPAIAARAARQWADATATPGRSRTTPRPVRAWRAASYRGRAALDLGTVLLRLTSGPPDPARDRRLHELLVWAVEVCRAPQPATGGPGAQGSETVLVRGPARST